MRCMETRNGWLSNIREPPVSADRPRRSLPPVILVILVGRQAARRRGRVRLDADGLRKLLTVHGQHDAVRARRDRRAAEPAAAAEAARATAEAAALARRLPLARLTALARRLRLGRRLLLRRR